MKTDFVDGRSLKIGSVFMQVGDKKNFYKVTDVKTSKPGKHGSAKSLVEGKNLLTGKLNSNTYLDGDKVIQIHDFGYIHSIVYDKRGSTIDIDLVNSVSIDINDFINENKEKIEEEFQKHEENGKKYSYKTAEGHPLVMRYSDVSGDGKDLFFWELFYAKPADLPKYGINNYLE